MVAASIDQARRSTFKLLREALAALDPDEAVWRLAESRNGCHAVHRDTNTRVSVLAASAKRAQGLVRCPLLIADEPGAWEVEGGEAMFDAITTALGKPGAPMRALIVGTLAPAHSGWWHELVSAGSGPGQFVEALQGDPAKWVPLVGDPAGQPPDGPLPRVAADPARRTGTRPGPTTRRGRGSCPTG